MKAPSIHKRVLAIRHHMDRKLPEKVSQRLYVQWDRAGHMYFYVDVARGLTGVAPHPNGNMHMFMVDKVFHPVYTAHFSEGWCRIIPKLLLILM